MSIFGAQEVDAPRFQDEARDYDAVLIMSFGGPEGHDDVMPFLENVAAGRNIPRVRLEEVAEHYHHFGGVSPINAQNRELITALEAELKANGPDLPIYFGNRNWNPFITDTVRQMRDDGIKRVIVFITSAFSSYSGCRQYREDIMKAVEEVGEGAPEFDRLRFFYNHPGFIEAMVDHVSEALAEFDANVSDVHLAFTAHSIPLSMAANCDYELQLAEATRLIAEGVGSSNFKLVYQSRSGPPHIPWLEPDICDYMELIHKEGTNNVIIIPIGFISDHMEVLFDLDTEAKDLAAALGMKMVRAKTVSAHPKYIHTIRDLIVERMTENPQRLSVGTLGPNHDICPLGCCLNG